MMCEGTRGREDSKHGIIEGSAPNRRNLTMPDWVILDRDETGNKSSYVGCGSEIGSKSKGLHRFS
jgi:hypothetical protein